MDKKVKIYCLVYKDIPFYIGSTKLPLKTRLSYHIRDILNRKKPKSQLKFFDNIDINNIYITVLENDISEDKRIETETKWFDEFISNEIYLINCVRPCELQFNYSKNHVGFGDKKSTKLNSTDVKEIIDLYKYTKMTCKDIAPIYNVSSALINGIIDGYKWKCITFGKPIIPIYPKRKTQNDRNKFFGVNKILNSSNKKRRKLKENEIVNIRMEYNNGNSLTNLSKSFGISVSSISKIVNNITYKDIN